MIECNKFDKDDKICVKKITESLYNILKIADEKHINFSDGDHNDIEEIIQCLQDLEEQRFNAHHLWEIESIKYEALRYKLTYYPSKITDEIQKAVSAARGLNEKTIDELRHTLNSINTNIDTNTNDLDRFNIENEKLIPDLKEIKLKHDEIIVLLNQHLSSKADEQINLNQIRDKIKKTNEKIVDLEEDVFHLKETMIKERAAAREEKKRLVQETNLTQEKLNSQNLKNDQLNTIYQNLKHEAAETTMVVNEKSSILRKYVKAIGELKNRQDILERNIEDSKESNEKLKQEIKQIEENSILSKYDFEKSKDNLEEEIAMLNDSVSNHKMIQFEVLSVKQQASEELENTQKIKDEVSLSLRSLMEKLKDIEESSASKAGDVGKLVYEMEEMEKGIIEGKEMHEASVMAINGQIVNLKKQLEKERKERLEVQKDNSNTQEQINLFRAEHSKFMKDNNKKINDSKSEHSRLQTQCQQLKRKIQEEITESNKLKISMKGNEEIFKKEENELKEKSGMLSKGIFEMEKNEEEIKRRLEENEPNFKELQIYYDKHMKDYEKLKKDLVGLKNRKSALDDAIERAKRSIAKENIDLEKLKEQKEFNESQLDSLIESEALKRNEIEKSIYVLGCKTSTTKEEIGNLQRSISEMDRRSRILRDNWEEAIHISSKMKQDLASQKGSLREAWSEDSFMESDFHKKESEEIEKLKNLLQNTEERGIVVATVSDKMFNEIQLFGQFLLNMSTISTKKDQKKDNEADKEMNSVIQKIENLTNTLNMLDTKLS